jgi:hypothetical protein
MGIVCPELMILGKDFLKKEIMVVVIRIIIGIYGLGAGKNFGRVYQKCAYNMKNKEYNK